MNAIRTLLVANRGEIACRVMRTARRMGIATVAVHSDADAGALHVRAADRAVRIGGPMVSESYLDMEAILEAAKRSGAAAVHPGYGFLSENSAFAEACRDAGLIFVGPPPAAIHAMGDKARSKRLMVEARVPVVPGHEGGDQSDAVLKRAAGEIGFPVLIKASAGGGGRGMRRVDAADGFDAALEGARREAESAFGDGTVLIEKLVTDARHIEIQIFADGHGNCIHLGERDCSAQRRHQKIIEESPSPFVTPEMRAAMGADAVKAALAVGYEGAGTVEFIVGADRRYFFLEMNTRLQVEHPVTEMVTGFDLVEWQLRIASGERLPVGQDDVPLQGHAIEARLYAEDPYDGFRPQTGEVLHWRPETAADGVRIDNGIAEGGAVTPYYDPMIAKLIAHGRDRAEAIARLRGALLAHPLVGPATNRGFLLDLLASQEFADGAMTTDRIDRWIAGEDAILARPTPSPDDWALAAAVLAVRAGGSWFRSNGIAECPVTLECGGERRVTKVRFERGRLAGVTLDGDAVAIESVEVDGTRVRARIGGVTAQALAVGDGRTLWLDRDGRSFAFAEPDLLAPRAQPSDPSRIVASVSGLLRGLEVKAGDAVAWGQRVGVIEAMKMENGLVAEADGMVAAVHAAAGEQVRAGELIIEIEVARG
ncbi:MAG: biotin carboxylase N-terminal domain-containing protein [Mesorhizobium sp.]|nr:biotin carboxylase N-terminal domain-containing protein [Mesorhizobium sp.]